MSRPEWVRPTEADVAKSYLGTLEREGGDCGAYVKYDCKSPDIPIHLGDTDSDALCNLLDFCGCGMPEKALLVVGDILEYFARNRDDKRTWAEELEARAAAFHTADEPTQYLLAYSLDNKNLMEHGSGIMYGWLTDLGKGVLADIRKVRQEEA